MADNAKGTRQKAKGDAPKKKGGPRRDPGKVDRFVEEKAKGATPAAAARAAELSDKPDSARVIGNRMMADPGIGARVEERRAELLDAARMDSEEVFGVFGLQMRGFDWADLFPDNDFIRKLKEHGVSSSVVIRKMKFDPVTQNVVEVEATDSFRAAAKVADLLEEVGRLGRPRRPRSPEERAERAAQILGAVKLRVVK